MEIYGISWWDKKNCSLPGVSAIERYKNKKLNAEMSTNVTQMCFAWKRWKRPFRARKPSNLPKVGVAKHEVGGTNLKVGGAVAPPTV